MSRNSSTAVLFPNVLWLCISENAIYHRRHGEDFYNTAYTHPAQATWHDVCWNRMWTGLGTSSRIQTDRDMIWFALTHCRSQAQKTTAGLWLIYQNHRMNSSVWAASLAEPLLKRLHFPLVESVAALCHMETGVQDSQTNRRFSQGPAQSFAQCFSCAALPVCRPTPGRNVYLPDCFRWHGDRRPRQKHAFVWFRQLSVMQEGLRYAVGHYISIWQCPPYLLFSCHYVALIPWFLRRHYLPSQLPNRFILLSPRSLTLSM